MLKASDAELAAFRAQLRSRLMVPADTPPEEVDIAFEEIADKIIAYLSSPVPSAPDRRTGWDLASHAEWGTAMQRRNRGQRR